MRKKLKKNKRIAEATSLTYYSSAAWLRDCFSCLSCSLIRILFIEGRYMLWVSVYVMLEDKSKISVSCWKGFFGIWIKQKTKQKKTCITLWNSNMYLTIFTSTQVHRCIMKIILSLFLFVNIRRDRLRIIFFVEEYKKRFFSFSNSVQTYIELYIIWKATTAKRCKYVRYVVRFEI